MPTSIHQEVTFKATPERIYEALMDSKEHAAFTANGAADIDRTEGGAFSAHDGHILGRTIELVRNRRIVQAWRPKTWPEGVYSIVRLELAEAGDETRLTLDQTGIPEGETGHLESGWHARYWEPLAKYLG